MGFGGSLPTALPHEHWLGSSVITTNNWNIKQYGNDMNAELLNQYFKFQFSSRAEG